MSETVDLIYDLMNNVCGSNWMGLLGINVCTSFSAVFDKSNNNKKIKKQALIHPHAHVGTNGFIYLSACI